MKTVFKNFIERLAEVPELRFVGEDWGQLYIDHPPVSFPCALIDLGEINYIQQGRNVQQAEAILNVTVADIFIDGMMAGTPEEVAESECSIYTVIEKVHARLQGYGTEKHSRLMRVSVRKIPREDTIREFLLTFKFSFSDCAAMPEYNLRPTPPNIMIKR